MRPTPLTVFFTYGVSVGTWATRGILDREIAPYRRLLSALGHVSFVTYGAGDGALADRLDGIRVLTPPPGLGSGPTSLLAPWIHRREIRAAAVLKTNQASGAWTAVIAKRLAGKPLIVRCGYAWSLTHARERSPRYRLVVFLERLAVRAADRVVVTTPGVADYLVRSHGLSRDRVRIVPNHVDTDRFAPGTARAREKGLLLFVGRLSREKNLAALLDAVSRLSGVRLLVVGDGPERAPLETRARQLKGRVTFAGTVPNDQLPALFARAEVFVMPSRYEGQPKAVLEAMAAGVAVLGADVPGIRELVRHGETGWLVPGDPDALAAGASALCNDPALRERLERAARDEVERHYSLDAVVSRELDVIRELAG